jgi:hypothetical protein
VAFSDLAKALAMLAVSLDGGVVQDHGISADVLAFKASAPHAGALALEDQVTFQFGNGADDDHDGPAQRAAGIDIFPKTDVLDLEPVKLVEDIEEVFHRSGDSVRRPDQDNVELTVAGIGHHGIESRSRVLRAADSIRVLMNDIEAALGGHLAQVKELRLRVLIER